MNVNTMPESAISFPKLLPGTESTRSSSSLSGRSDASDTSVNLDDFVDHISSKDDKEQYSLIDDFIHARANKESMGMLEIIQETDEKRYDSLLKGLIKNALVFARHEGPKEEQASMLAELSPFVLDPDMRADMRLRAEASTSMVSYAAANKIYNKLVLDSTKDHQVTLALRLFKNFAEKTAASYGKSRIPTETKKQLAELAAGIIESDPALDSLHYSYNMNAEAAQALKSSRLSTNELATLSLWPRSAKQRQEYRNLALENIESSSNSLKSQVDIFRYSVMDPALQDPEINALDKLRSVEELKKLLFQTVQDARRKKLHQGKQLVDLLHIAMQIPKSSGENVFSKLTNKEIDFLLDSSSVRQYLRSEPDAVSILQDLFKQSEYKDTSSHLVELFKSNFHESSDPDKLSDYLDFIELEIRKNGRSKLANSMFDTARSLTSNDIQSSVFSRLAKIAQKLNKDDLAKRLTTKAKYLHAIESYIENSFRSHSIQDPVQRLELFGERDDAREQAISLAKRLQDGHGLPFLIELKRSYNNDNQFYKEDDSLLKPFAETKAELTPILISEIRAAALKRPKEIALHFLAKALKFEDQGPAQNALIDIAEEVHGPRTGKEKDGPIIPLADFALRFKSQSHELLFAKILRSLVDAGPQTRENTLRAIEPRLDTYPDLDTFAESMPLAFDEHSESSVERTLWVRNLEALIHTLASPTQFENRIIRHPDSDPRVLLERDFQEALHTQDDEPSEYAKMLRTNVYHKLHEVGVAGSERLRYLEGLRDIALEHSSAFEAHGYDIEGAEIARALDDEKGSDYLINRATISNKPEQLQDAIDAIVRHPHAFDTIQIQKMNSLLEEHPKVQDAFLKRVKDLAITIPEVSHRTEIVDVVEYLDKSNMAERAQYESEDEE